MINWTSIGKVRANHGIHRIVRTSKMMYRWLPVGHNWIKCNLASDKCPCCSAPDETFEHLIGCKNDKMEEVRQTAYQTIQNTLTKKKIPLPFAMAFLATVKAGLGQM